MTGFVNIDKACGVSSAREVAIVKRLTGTPCGHLGTLDPLASGVLPIAIGNAARLFDYFLSKSKTYEATFIFGVGYDTLDTSGVLTDEGGRVPAKDEICAVLPEFVGEIMQTPPRYSAKNLNGRRAYDLARKGIDFQLPPKKVTIHSIDFLGGGDNAFTFRIKCGGGTYIRSIARDIAQRLGTVAAMSALRRTQSGAFDIQNAVQSERLNKENIKDYIIPTDSVLPFQDFHADGREAKRLFNGLNIEVGLSDGTYKIYDEYNRFYGLGAVNGGILKVRTKLC